MSAPSRTEPGWPRAVAGYSEGELERFAEVAGQALSEGADATVADQRGMLAVVQMRRARREAAA